MNGSVPSAEPPPTPNRNKLNIHPNSPAVLPGLFHVKNRPDFISEVVKSYLRAVFIYITLLIGG